MSPGGSGGNALESVFRAEDAIGVVGRLHERSWCVKVF